MLALIIGLPVLLAVAVTVVALLTDEEQPAPLALPSIPAPAADSPQCRGLLDRLPATLASAGSELDRRTLAAPQPPATAAWGHSTDPVVLRCGIERPAELTRTAPLLDVSGVRWLRISASTVSTWVAVDRPVYVGLTFADDTGTGPVQDISAAITAALPAQRVQPAD